jgi:membrane protease YdiL (CAAX protease family)
MSAILSTSVRPKESFVQKYPLATFFLLAIGLTWIFMITDALGSHGILPFRLPLPLMLVMGYMPTLAAVIVAGRMQGKAGVRALFSKLFIARVGIGWYLFAIFGFAAFSVVALELYNLFGDGPVLPLLSTKLPQFSNPLQLILYVVPMFIVITLINGEELAWRGFALPRLQAKYNALTSSVILGLLWTLFHLPLFFTLTGSSQVDESFVSFLISTVGLTVLYTWMYNHTRGSVLLAYLFHGAINTWTQLFSIDHNGSAFVGWTMTGLIVLTAVIVVLVTGPEHLSRKNARLQE